MMPQPSATSTTTFVFSLPSRLSNSRLRLEPFALSTHAAAFVNGTKHHPDLFQYRSHGPWETVVEFEAFYNARVADNATDTCFAVLVQEERRGDGGGVEEEEEEGCGEDRRVGGVFAGVIGLENASVRDCSVEIGFLTILPPFQRSFVASNAVGLLLQYVLNPSPQGLGLRRCQWQCHMENEASKRVAVKMGFVLEGVRRLERVVPRGRRGNGYSFGEERGGEDVGGLGESRDSAMFALCCDEWEGKRGEVVEVLERR